MRKFEKINYDQFVKDVCDDRALYDSIELPKRSTKLSAGYDIRTIEGYTLSPGESKIFHTGVKVSMEKDDVFLIFDRSSIGFKYDTTLSNSVGVIDCDFYSNPENDGHFAVKLINHSKKDLEIHVGDRIAQGIFVKYLTVDDEEEVKLVRKGGSGFTGRK